MNRLEEIKNEYLKSLGYRNYNHLVADIKSGKSPIEKLILLEDDISEKYATECVKASLEKASEKGCDSLELYNSEYETLKKAITNPENIILL